MSEYKSYSKQFKNLVITLALVGTLLVFICMQSSLSWRIVFRSKELYAFISLTLLGSYLAGLQLSVLLKKQGTPISMADQVLLPLSMALFGYILPTNGGIVFSIFFLKSKYNVTPRSSLSIAIMVLYGSFLFTGFTGIACSAIYPNTAKLLIPFSILFCALPWTIKVAVAVLKGLDDTRYSILSRVIAALTAIVSQTNEDLTDRRTLASILGINLLMVVVQIASMYYITVIVGNHISLLQMTFIVLLLRISSIIRILPGNLGVEELLAGGAFSALGFDGSAGIITFGIARTISLLLIITPLGIMHLSMNRKFLKLSNIWRTDNSIANE